MMMFRSTYLVFTFVSVCIACAAHVTAAVEITEEEYEGRSQFQINTHTATYYLDRKAGGFSRLIDKSGKDWIAFHKEPLNQFPASAAAGYRGIPNLVFGRNNPDAGAGHPGFDRCTSEVIGPDSIRTQSNSGKWAWQWKFTDKHATLTILKVDPDHPYWFLYEGAIAGKWSPKSHYFGTDLGGPRRDQPDSRNQLFNRWRWAYFGDDSARQVLLIAQLHPDELPDTLWYLGDSENGIKSHDGMVVFGFGRDKGAKPMLRDAAQQFRISLVDIPSSTEPGNSAVQDLMSEIAGGWLTTASDGQPPEEDVPCGQAAESVDVKKGAQPWRGPQPAEGRPWPSEGHFFHRFWFQMGDDFANPPVNDRFRVNDPYVATHPNFHHRREPRGNGMMLIPMQQSLPEVDAARLYLELWGGHPHTSNRRVTVNGRTTYPITVPSDDQCTHAYRYVPLKITDLVRGPNAIQFAVDGEDTFWGHFIVEEAAIDVLMSASEEFKRWSALVPVPPTVIVDRTEPEAFSLALKVDATAAPTITSVHYFAKYAGFDENGDGQVSDWHGMTKRKQPVGHVGTATKFPYAVRWDTSMIKAQEGVQIRALVELAGSKQMIEAENELRLQGNRFWKAEGRYWQTDPSPQLTITHPDGIQVAYVPSEKASIPFWSRANRKRDCEFAMPTDRIQIERAELNIVVWDGGAGDVKEYFKINGHALAVAANAAHDVIHSRLPLEPSWISPDTNRAELLSDTDHHGIEILYPGPMITLRYRSQ